MESVLGEDQKVIPLRPPYWALAYPNAGGRPEWVRMNDSTTFWFTSKEAAEEFIHGEPRIRGAWPRHLHDWPTVLMALEQLGILGLHYLLLNPVTTEERRVLVDDIARQIREVKPYGSVTVNAWDNLINSIDIYGDEGGYGPVKDSDEVLVVSALAVPRGIVSEIPLKRQNLESTVKHLGHFQAALATGIVKPTPGYGDALAKKVAKYQFVATVNGELGRPRVWFDDGSQIRPNNLVWATAMDLLMAWVIPLAAKRKNIFVEHVRIFLNSISATPQMRKFFRDLATQHIPQSSVDVCIANADNMDLPPEYRTASLRWADKFRFKSVSVQFDDEKPFDGDKGFMWLADSAAHYAFRELRNVEPHPGFLDALRPIGKQGEEVQNLTDAVIFHDPRSLDRWEAETGTKVPD
jgi:hypothetical protein